VVKQPILTKDGAHEVTISPDESTLLVRYSYKKTLGIIAANKKDAILTAITHSTTKV
jgi:hypothetical protein